MLGSGSRRLSDLAQRLARSPALNPVGRAFPSIARARRAAANSLGHRGIVVGGPKPCRPHDAGTAARVARVTATPPAPDIVASALASTWALLAASLRDGWTRELGRAAGTS